MYKTRMNNYLRRVGEELSKAYHYGTNINMTTKGGEVLEQLMKLIKSVR